MLEHLSTYSKFKSSKKYKNSGTVARILETTETFKTHRKTLTNYEGRKQVDCEVKKEVLC